MTQAFQRRGYLVERLSYQQLKFYREYHARAEAVCQLHRQQTEEVIRALRKKYQKPVLGKVEVWDLLMMLGNCVDVGDHTLYCTSQLTHVMQMLAAMERDRISDPDLYIAALVHDSFFGWLESSHPSPLPWREGIREWIGSPLTLAEGLGMKTLSFCQLTRSTPIRMVFTMSKSFSLN